MSRARTSGTLLCVLGVAAALTGCGASSGGTVAAEEPPAAPATPAADGGAVPQSGAAPATGGASAQALGAFPQADPTAPSFHGFKRFSPSRVVNVFDAPAEPAETAPTAPGGLPQPSTAVPAAPSTPTPTTPAPTTTPTTAPAPSTAASYTATAEVNGAQTPVNVGDQIPKDDPQFTVASVDATKIVLKLNSGTFPGGSTTMDIAAGAAVTLTNPTSQASIVVRIRSIVPAAG